MPKPKITVAQYEYAKEQYVSAKEKYGMIFEIAKGLDITASGLRKRFIKDGLVETTSTKKRTENKKPSAKEVAKEASDNIIKSSPFYENKTPEEREKLIKDDYFKWMHSVSRMSVNYPVRAKGDSVALGYFKDDIMVMKNIMDILDKSYKSIAQMNGFNSDVEKEDLPTFTVHEMTAEDVEDVRRAQRQQAEEMRTGNIGDNTIDS